MHARVCVLTGTQQALMFDPDTFRRLVKDLRDNDITVIADLSEAHYEQHSRQVSTC